MKMIKKGDLLNTTFLQTPRWLFNLLVSGKITPGAYATYILMYDRLRLSIENNWFDEKGHAYIRYSYDEMGKHLDTSRTQIKRNLDKLEELGLIVKKRNFSASSIFYLQMYSEDNLSISPQSGTSDKKLTTISPQSGTIISPQFVDANNNNFNHNNTNKKNHDNHDKKNVIDNFDDFEKLVKEISDDQLNFTKTVRGAINKLLKTMSRKNIKSYIMELYSALKNNPQVIDPNKVFVEKLKKGERQVNVPVKIVVTEQVTAETLTEQEETRESKKLIREFDYCLSLASECGWSSQYTASYFENSVHGCSTEKVQGYSQKLKEFMDGRKKAGV